MELSSQPLATDSFSYSWLTDRRPSFDSLVESLRPSFDTNCDESMIKEFMQALHHNNTDQDFDFNIIVPEPKSSDSPIHADEIFSDGCIMPVYPNHPASMSLPATPVSSLTSISKRSSDAKQRSPCGLFKKFMESSNRAFKKSFSFFSKLGCSRDSVRVDDLHRKVKENRVCHNLNQPSPKRRAGGGGAGAKAYDYNVYWGEIRRKGKKSDAYNRLRDVRSCNNSPWVSPPRSMDPWRHVECLIDEAILHCKRSFAAK